jgi:hypothetical protein
MPAPAQEWLRWQETPLSGERDPGKRAPPPSPPPSKPAMQAPTELVPLRELATAGASQSAPLVEPARASAARQQAGAESPPPSASPSVPPRSDPARPMRIAKSRHVASVARSQPATVPIAKPVVDPPGTAAIFALQRDRHTAVAALRIFDVNLHFAPSRPAMPKMWSMSVTTQAPIPLSTAHSHHPPLPAPVPRPQIPPPATVGSAPPTHGSHAIAAALRIDDAGARLARPQTAPLMLPSPVSTGVSGNAAVAADDDTAALPPCVLRMRRARAGATGIAYLPRNEASQPCPAAVDAATLDAQRGSGGRTAPQQAHADLLRSMLQGR